MTKGMAGIILAGGRATRMGGQDKGLLPLSSDVCLLDEVIARLSPQVDAMAINANGDPDRFSGFGLTVLHDNITGFVGPLAGVLAALDWAADQGFESVVSVAADTPFFPRNLVSKLVDFSGPTGLAIAASYDEQGKLWRQPTFGLWPVSLRDDLRGALTQEGLRKIVIWTDRHSAGQAEFDANPDGTDPFFNVNTPEDLETAQSIYSAQEPG